MPQLETISGTQIVILDKTIEFRKDLLSTAGAGRGNEGLDDGESNLGVGGV